MRGSVADGIFILIIIFVFVISTFIALTVLNAFNTQLRATAGINETNIPNITTNLETNSYTAFDSGFAFLFIGGNLIVIFLSWLVRSNPIFFILSILGIVVMSTLALFFGNIYFEFVSTNDQLGATASHLSITDFIMKNILALQMIFAFIDIIILSGVGQSGDRGGANYV